ncbi:magnesium transporter MRS2 homolog, mitochondrial [Aegotheles albertisi]
MASVYTSKISRGRRWQRATRHPGLRGLREACGHRSRARDCPGLAEIPPPRPAPPRLRRGNPAAARAPPAPRLRAESWAGPGRAGLGRTVRELRGACAPMLPRALRRSCGAVAGCCCAPRGGSCLRAALGLPPDRGRPAGVVVPPCARGLRWAGKLYQRAAAEASQATLASVAPVFAVMKFDKEGNTTYFEKKKTELYQELGLQARDLRFQHLMSIATRNNRIIMRMEFLKAVITPEVLLILDYRNLNLEHWLSNELASQLAGEGQLVTYSLPFEFRAIEAILQYRISKLQGRLNTLQPQILETLEALVDPKLLSVDRSKLHILLQNGKSLSELETDLKVFKETILEILDEEELIEELCLSKWTDPQVFEESTSGIDHAEEMELLLENYYRQAEDLANEARELRVLIDDSESIIFINLDSHRNVMMRLNLQLTMGTFSLSLFGLIGVAFGMNLESSLEEDPRIFWLVTGIMFLGSGLIWRRLLSFLGRHLEPPLPSHVPAVWKKSLSAAARVEIKNNVKAETQGLSRSTLTNH